MGKRKSPITLSSSDDEDDNGNAFRSNRSYSKPKSKPLITRTNPRQSKKPRVPSFQSRSTRKSSNVDAIGFPVDDFQDLFCAPKVSTDTGVRNVDELWVDKYKSGSLEELAVHKKKVEEVKLWFEERLKVPKEDVKNYGLIITGQAGVGKSATVHTIASHLSAKLFEWNTPIPTIWQEHVHNSNSGIRYTSKLDEFVNFIEKVRKYGLIPTTLESKPSTILLIDDIPLTNGRVAFERLQNCLILLVRSTQIPTAILVTDCGKSDSADNNFRYLEELQLSLENAGACKVSFNPVTNNSVKKTLSRICRLEHCNVTTEQIDMIAKSSGGDIRHAITSLQLFCVKPNLVPSLSLPNSCLKYENADEMNSLVSGFSSLFGRDESLSLFHALGKFLHNKRETEVITGVGKEGFLIREKFSRLPLKMDTPEMVLCQAHGQARSIADFLHENVLDFMSEEAMGDAWDVASYLSDADLLLSSFHGMMSRYNEAESILQSSAASVACRGVLFGNFHPSTSRWHAIRRPRLWQVEKSLFRSHEEMVRQRFMVYSGSSSSCLADVATEYAPAMRQLGSRASGLEMNDQEHLLHHKEAGEDGSADCDNCKISDDDIEDW